MDVLPQSWLLPPSTTISVPSINDEASEARKRATSACSDGSEARPIGTRAETVASVFSASANGPALVKIEVLVGPGDRQKTRMRRGSRSADSVLARLRETAFEAPYSAMLGWPVLAAIDPVRITTPP